MDEVEYECVVQWYCQQRYYNEMLSFARQACDMYPNHDRLRILLALAYSLTDHAKESLKETSLLLGNSDAVLSALLIQSFVHKTYGTADRTVVMQIDTRIREDRRKATFYSLSLGATVLLLLEKYDKAKEYADRAYKLNPDDSTVLISKGWSALSFETENFLAKSPNYFEVALKENSKNMNALMGSAKLKVLRGDNVGATSILNTLIVHYPKLSIPLVEKIFNQLTLEDWEQVLETANRILSIESNNLDAIKAKAVVSFCRDGEYSEGTKYVQQFFRNLILAEPKNVALLVDNVRLFSRIAVRHQTVLAELFKCTEKMAQNNPHNGEIMAELGNLCLRMEKYKDAEHWFRSTVRLDESSFPALMGLAYCQLFDTSHVAEDLARQQVDFLMGMKPDVVIPELVFMLAKLSRHEPTKAIVRLGEAATALLKNCGSLPYGYEYLKRLNPDLCLDIVDEFLLHSPSAGLTGQSTFDSSQDKSKIPCLRILEKVTEACPGLGSALLLLGSFRMQIGDYDGALASLQKLLDFVDTTNAQAHLLMAQIFVLKGQFQLASQTLEVGLSYNFKVRDDPMYHMIIGMVAKENGELKECIHHFESAMKASGMKPGRDKVTQLSISNKATLYLELISAYSKLRMFSDAVALMEDTKIQLAGTTEAGRAIVGNAELCLEMGEVDKAIGYLSKVSSDEPYYLQARTKLAEIYLHHRKDRVSFAKCFRDLVENCPGPKTYSMLGDAYVAIQEPEKAIEAYEQSLTSNPGDKSLARKMGLALVRTHQYVKAINYYKECIKQERCGDLKLDMAELFMKMKQFDRAEAELVQELQEGRSGNDLQALELRGKQLLLLAKVRERADNIKGALGTLKEARENQVRYIQRASMLPNVSDQKSVLADICYAIAEHATALRDFDMATAHYKEALVNKQNDVKTLLSLAKLYMQMNDLDRCTHTCSTLLNTDPNNEAACVMMADLAFRKVDFDTAAYHFRQLLLQRPTYWTALARLIEVSRRTGNMDDLEEWLVRAEAAMDGTKQEAGYFYCSGLLDWRTGRLNSALRNFNSARRDQEWGQQAIYNMIEICLDPDDDSTLSNEAFNDEDAEYQDSRTMALKTAQRLLQELNPKGNPHEMLTHRLLSNFLLLATKQKSNAERVLADCTALASQETLRDHVGPALGLAMAHIQLKQQHRARNHLKRVSKNTWSFEDAEYLERCWLLLAEIYSQSGKYDLANDLLKRVLQHNATCVRAHEILGFIAEKDPSFKEAALRYGLAWKYGGKYKLSIGYKLAYCSFKSKSFATAIEVCNEVLRQNPDYPRIRKEILDKAVNNLRS